MVGGVCVTPHVPRGQGVAAGEGNLGGTRGARASGSGRAEGKASTPGARVRRDSHGGGGFGSDSFRQEGARGNTRGRGEIFRGAWLETAARNRALRGVKTGRPTGFATTKQLITKYGKEEYEFYVAFHVAGLYELNPVDPQA